MTARVTSTHRMLFAQLKLPPLHQLITAGEKSPIYAF